MTDERDSGGVELLISADDLPWMPPLPETFARSDYLENGALTGLAGEVMAEYFTHRQDIVEAWDDSEIHVRWKKKGTPTAIGKCSLSTAVARHYGAPTFFIWLGAENLRDRAANRGQIKALLHHELLHVGFDMESGASRVVPHDSEVFFEEISAHGGYWPDVRALIATCRSLPAAS